MNICNLTTSTQIRMCEMAIEDVKYQIEILKKNKYNLEYNEYRKQYVVLQNMLHRWNKYYNKLN